MEKIDTIFLSGGGMKCLSILGVLKYLFEKDIIKENFDGIKDIYLISGSSIYLTPLLLGFSMESTLELFKKLDYKKLSGIDDIKIQNLFDNYGFKKITDYRYIMEAVVKGKNVDPDITLKELYNLTNINLHFRVINVNKQCNEYLNKDNSPDLKFTDAICMTSCIPILFEPIEYNGSLYIDGGVNNNFPYEKVIDKKNYLGIDILSSKISCGKDREKEEIKSLTDYMNILYNIYGSPPIIKPTINHIQILIDGCGINFDRFSESMDETLLLGYNTCEEHFSNFQKHNDSSHHKNED
jgi:NTE family protein